MDKTVTNDVTVISSKVKANQGNVVGPTQRASVKDQGVQEARKGGEVRRGKGGKGGRGGRAGFTEQVDLDSPLASPDRAQILEEELRENQKTLGSIKKSLKEINLRADNMDPETMVARMDKLVQMAEATSNQLVTRTMMSEEQLDYVELEETINCSQSKTQI